MEQELQTGNHVLGAVTSPIRGLLYVILGLGGVLAFIGVVGTLLGVTVLHLLSPQASVGPLLRLAGLAALGGVVFIAACALPNALSKRR